MAHSLKSISHLRLPIQYSISAITLPCIVLIPQSSTSAVRGSHNDNWISTFALKWSALTSSQKRYFKATNRNSQKAKRQAKESKTPYDPLDVTILKSNVDKVIEKLKTDLSKLRGGGRFDHAIVEQLRVQPQKESKETVKLGTLAQLVPKIRFLNVVVGEPEHIKPVLFAISSSGHSLVPQQPTADAPTTITVPLPSPTGDARRATLASAKKAADGASTAVKMARQKHHKMLRNLELERKTRPDDIRKANSIMEKVIEAANKSVKTVSDNAKKALESS